MGEVQKKGFPLVGAIFLALGVYKLLTGGDWVVWIILGALLGGLGALSWKRDAERS
ncbi:hypothetical protein SH584_00215 [Sphingomonas sp. LY29]|uniref:hypothetical protein n=1 Tax=Sphingomonas sp. LY29 TaxID=3095341 RepID=UPI002D76F7F3|nr:hypothetical protein [Sphingomonas sp. LY29]WRP25912.1 hypothetical protein SH584_00215 [Sphingomonas sp. LY29]